MGKGSARVSSGVRTAIRGVGQTLITVGVLLLLYVVWSLWFTGIGTAREQNALYADLSDLWGSLQTGDVPLEEVEIGDGIAIMRIPRFGAEWHPVVVEGTGREELKTGPGHYVDTAMPGEIGNFSVAGHRTTYGAPFNRLDEMRDGDPIVVETATAWYTYDVTEVHIVLPTDVEVVAPVPGRPGETPTEALLTLTTCHPEYSSRERLIVHAELVDTRDQDTGPPPVLTDPDSYAREGVS